MAQPAPVHAQDQAPLAQPGQTAAVGGAPSLVGAAPAPAPEPAKRSPAHYRWAVLIARIYAVFPLTCPTCAGQMRIIAFITDGQEVRKILAHIGADSQAPRITPARGPPLWEDCGALVGEGVEVKPDWVGHFGTDRTGRSAHPLVIT